MEDATINPVRPYEPVAPVRERDDRSPGGSRGRSRKPSETSTPVPGSDVVPSPRPVPIEPGRPGHHIDDHA